MIAASARRDQRLITGKTRLGSARGGRAEKPMRKERGTPAGGLGPVWVPQDKAPQRHAAPSPIHGPVELTFRNPSANPRGILSHRGPYHQSEGCLALDVTRRPSRVPAVG